MRRILVTGGSGFIGTNLVEQFRAAGEVVCNFDILPPRDPGHSSLWKKVDLRDRKQLIDAVHAFHPEMIVHCAARTDLNEQKNLDGYSANIDGVCHLIEAVRGLGSVERTIFFSSQLVCRLDYRPTDMDDYLPGTLYGRSKVLGEKIVKTCGEFNTTWTIVRPTSLWGPWFDIPYRTFFNTIRRGMYVHPKGVQTLKQWGYVGNTVHQIGRLLEAPREAVRGRIFYMADYEPVELREFADKVQEALGARKIPQIAYGLLKAAGIGGDVLQRVGWSAPPLTSFRLGNIIMNEIQDLSPLEDIVGPLPFSIQDGIHATVQWLNQHQ